MAVTTKETVAGVLGIQNADAAPFTTGYLAAESAVASGCRWPTQDASGAEVPAPDALVQAVVLRTARYLARLDSPSGVIGVGEYGPVRIASVDRDIEELEAPWRRVVFA